MSSSKYDAYTTSSDGGQKWSVALEFLTKCAARELNSRQAFGTDADYVLGNTDLPLDSKF